MYINMNLVLFIGTAENRHLIDKNTKSNKSDLIEFDKIKKILLNNIPINSYYYLTIDHNFTNNPKNTAFP